MSEVGASPEPRLARLPRAANKAMKRTVPLACDVLAASGKRGPSYLKVASKSRAACCSKSHATLACK